MSETSFSSIKRAGYFRVLDYWMLIPVLILCLIGLFTLSRVLRSGYADYPMILYKQAGAVMVGLLLAMFISGLETPTLKPLAWFFYGSSIVLLVAVLFFYDRAQAAQWGAKSWLRLPVIGTFQPSELVKIGLSMTAAQVFELIEERRIAVWKGILLIGLLFGVPLVLIREQPDMGTAIVIIFMGACMFFVWGLRWRYVLLSLSGFAALVPIVWFFYLKDFQRNRILSFLYPGHNPVTAYNQTQSQLAIQAGGLTGNPGKPIQVPVKEADFIFAGVAEHMGFIGTTALIVMAFFFLARCLYVSSKMRRIRSSSALTMVGLTSVLAFHFIENLGMCVGLLPITGIPLPFVSQGGSAMLVNLMALGLMLQISMERNLSRTSVQ